MTDGRFGTTYLEMWDGRGDVSGTGRARGVTGTRGVRRVPRFAGGGGRVVGGGGRVTGGGVEWRVGGGVVDGGWVEWRARAVEWLVGGGRVVGGDGQVAGVG